MRPVLLYLTLTAAIYGQSMTEAAAAVAGGTVGGAAGKKVSAGIDAIFGKVDGTMKAAAGDAKGKQPSLTVGPGKVRTDTVPPPPPPFRPTRTPRVDRPQVPVVTAYVPEPTVQPAPPPAPAPRVTTTELAQITTGTSREEVLKLGTPAAKITMVEGGHLVEVYRYSDKDSTLGAVRLSDGAVSNVILRR